MQPTTPIASRTTSELPTCFSNSYPVARPAAIWKLALGRPTWMMPASFTGMPTSWAMVVASSSLRASRPAWIFIR